VTEIIEHVSLRDYLEAMIGELDKRIVGQIQDRDVRIELALSAAKEAVTKSEDAYNKRFQLLNEFRGQSQDEQRKFALKALVDAERDTQDARVGRLETTVATLQGRAIAFAGFGALLGGVATALILRSLG
jgi:hypothetical protein